LESLLLIVNACRQLYTEKLNVNYENCRISIILDFQSETQFGL